MQTKTLINSTVIKQVFIFSCLMSMMFLLVQPKSAMAHATLVKSDPPRRASLSEAPKQVQLWFNEEIEGNYASVTLLDADKNSVTDAEPEPVTDDLKSIVLDIPEIGPGSYTVEYRVLSVDGHVVESSFGFRIKDITQ